MEKFKFTVRVDAHAFKSAKHYAGQHGTTITRLVEAYFRSLHKINQINTDTPILRELAGSLGQDVSLDDYREYLEGKYIDDPGESS
ncbi:MAG: DUF6364 family protein [Anaerolineales bacterium]